MKKIKYLIMTLMIIALITSIIVVAQPDFRAVEVNKAQAPVTVTIPTHAIEVAPGVFDLGKSVDKDGRPVRGFAFIDYRKEFHHRDWHNGGPGGPGGNGGSTCFEFLAKGAKWKTTEDYVLDSTNSNGLSDSFVASKTALGIEEWDSQVDFDIFGSRDTTSSVDGADTSSPDNKNEIMFGNLDSENAIAVTIVWGVFIGPPSQRRLVEWDMVFNDASFTFGDADSDPSVFDYQNIFTHEIGHAVGMAHPGDTCTEETMFRFAGEGETKKRDLNSGDINGVNELYS